MTFNIREGFFKRRQNPKGFGLIRDKCFALGTVGKERGKCFALGTGTS